MDAPAGRWRSTPESRVTLALLAVLTITVLVALTIRSGFIVPYADTALTALQDTLTGRYGQDSWRPMHAALVAWRQGEDIYEATLFASPAVKFQYPPVTLLLAQLADQISPTDYRAFYLAPTLAFLAVTIVASDMVLAKTLGLQGIEAYRGAGAWLRLALITGLALTSWPLIRGVSHGQIQVWIDGLFALSLLAWMSNRQAAAGVLIACACLIKPQLGLFVLWALWRREWRFAAALALAGAAGLIISLAMFGWQNHLSYVDALGLMADRGEGFWRNQSFNGLLNRLLSIDDPVGHNNIHWLDRFPDHSDLVRYGTLVTSALILLPALLRKREGTSARTYDFCTFGLAATMASPIAWDHHYGITFPIFALMLAGDLSSRARLALLAASYVLIHQLFMILNQSAETPFNFIQSPVLFGGLLLLALLHTAKPQAPGSSFGDASRRLAHHDAGTAPT